MHHRSNIAETLKYELQDYIKNALVTIKETTKEIKVTVKTISEFDDVYSDHEKGLWYMGKGRQRSVKRILKSMGFSFDGSGTHRLEKYNYDSDRILIHKEQVMSGNYKNISFMKSFIDYYTDDNGMVDILKVENYIVEMKEDWLHNFNEFNKTINTYVSQY